MDILTINLLTVNRGVSLIILINIIEFSDLSLRLISEIKFEKRVMIHLFFLVSCVLRMFRILRIGGKLIST